MTAITINLLESMVERPILFDLFYSVSHSQTCQYGCSYKILNSLTTLIRLCTIVIPDSLVSLKLSRKPNSRS